MTVPSQDWMAQGACRETPTRLWFSADFSFPIRRMEEDAAKLICSRCPVRQECADYGMGERYGIWGGLTASERRTIKRRPYRRPPLVDNDPRHGTNNAYTNHKCRCYPCVVAHSTYEQERRLRQRELELAQ